MPRSAMLSLKLPVNNSNEKATIFWMLSITVVTSWKFSILGAVFSASVQGESNENTATLPIMGQQRELARMCIDF